MYKLMIVDDEYLVRDGIENTIDWRSINVEIVESATDGIDALEKIPVYKPDIIVTDIKMDKMDGLMLVEEAGRRYPNIKFVIISGYDDPEYLRKSLRLKVYSYLLKPLSEEELLEAVRQQILEIEKENALRQKIKLVDRELAQNRCLFIESLLNDLLNGKVEDQNELESRAGFLQISFRQPSYCCALFSVLGYQDIIRDSGFQRLRNLYLSIEEIIKDIWEGEVWPVHFAQDKLIVILGSTDPLNGLEEVVEAIDKLMDVLVVVATGEPCDQIIHIWKSYKQASIAYEGNSSPDLSGIVSLNEIPGVPGQRFIYPAEKENKLIHSCFQCKDKKDIDIKLTDFFDAMEQQGCTIERMRTEIMGFLAVFLRKVSDMGVDIYLLYGCGLPDMYAALAQCRTRKNLEDWLRQILHQTSQLIQNNKDNHVNALIVKANQYMYDNFCKEDLSLDEIAAYLRINPSYFSRLYKKETGQSFIEKLTSIRLEKAKSLLTSTNEKIADIAKMVGYQHSRYFWNIFKKYTGCSPSEFRETFM